ncbi:hypothetical protein CFN78_06005 [Amycolatopsis antarctica]|uniref:Uncharacterized protein n=1 Tax=Amycolatopsis antarctica TaxID=1854586 RepID=A0A263D5S4_9PSEU|nr:hypothetical protein [Amycolatopsis antarctica]OZM73854.1 hypothetical protein CFN78_06005 [Amycolatopsis antarctica]
MSTQSSSRGAAAFDVRLIIALLVGVYGLVITVMGIGFTSQDDLDKADGMNINLYAGIAMLVFAGLFVLWAKVRPLQLEMTPEQQQESATEEPNQAP